MTGSGRSFADQIMSEVTLSLFTHLAREEGPSLSDITGGPSRTEPVGRSADLTLRNGQSWLAARPWWGHRQTTSWASISSSINGTIIAAGGGVGRGHDVRQPIKRLGKNNVPSNKKKIVKRAWTVASGKSGFKPDSCHSPDNLHVFIQLTAEPQLPHL